jgi:RNA polymerase sporulation-specific sigma factor
VAAAETAAEPVVSLQSESENGLTLEGLLSAGNEEESLLERLTLRAAMAALPEKEQQVLWLRYDRGMTQVSAAKVLGVSQVQVSRLERRALKQLRETLSMG